MKHFPPSCFLLGWILCLHPVTAIDDGLSCACALEASNNVLDCSNGNTLLDAYANLQSNACQLDCTSSVCQANYYMVQAHHDYCFGSELPEGLASGIHTFEANCQDCHVIRHTDPSLPSCPAANCEDTSGNAAYAFLLSNSCQQDCNTDPDCGRNFRTLRAVYEACPDETLATVAELGINDLDSPCAEQDCNTGDASTDASQRVCNRDDGLATRPPAVAQPTSSPTVAPDLECPEWVKPFSASLKSSCSICGPNQCVAKPDTLFEWPGQPAVSCYALQEAGLQGYLTSEQCAALPDLVRHICACGTADLFVPYTIPATGAPTPVTSPVSSPSLSATETRTDGSQSSSGFGVAAIVGIVVAGVVAAIGTVFFFKRRSPTKETSISEIEVATITHQTKDMDQVIA